MTLNTWSGKFKYVNCLLLQSFALTFRIAFGKINHNIHFRSAPLRPVRPALICFYTVVLSFKNPKIFRRLLKNPRGVLFTLVARGAFKLLYSCVSLIDVVPIFIIGESWNRFAERCR